MSTDLAVQEREDQDVGVGDYQFGFHDPTDKYVFKSRRGLDREIVYQISEMKKEPKWMRDFRISSLETFFQKPMPSWGGAVEEIDFQNIFYYMKAAANLEKSWEDVPQDGIGFWKKVSSELMRKSRIHFGSFFISEI